MTATGKSTKKRILIVEDNPTNMKLLINLLSIKDNEFETIEASNADQVNESINEHNSNIDLILMDLQLPDKNGFEIIDDLKSNPQTYNIPIIVVSAYDNEEFKHRIFQSGCVDYITKPIDSSNFLAVIENLFINKK